MDNTYSISEVAEKLGLSDKTLRRWEEAGKFASPRTLGNQRRYTIEDLQILDAIKHGTIPDQKDLLTREQAALLLNVSPVTVDRYVAEGKIHPFITVGNTFFPRHILETKGMILDRNPRVQPEEGSPTGERIIPKVAPPLTPHASHDPVPLNVAPLANVPLAPKVSRGTVSLIKSPLLPNFLLTLLLLTLYHFTFNSHPTPVSPTPAGSVQGVSTISPQLLNLLEDILDPSGNISGSTVTGKNGLMTPILSLTPSVAPLSPAPGTVYYDATKQALQIYVNGTWLPLATTTDVKNATFSLESNLASISAELHTLSASPSATR